MQLHLSAKTRQNVTQLYKFRKRKRHRNFILFLHLFEWFPPLTVVALQAHCCGKDNRGRVPNRYRPPSSPTPLYLDPLYRRLQSDAEPFELHRTRCRPALSSSNSERPWLHPFSGNDTSWWASAPSSAPGPSSSTEAYPLPCRCVLSAAAFRRTITH